MVFLLCCACEAENSPPASTPPAADADTKQPPDTPALLDTQEPVDTNEPVDTAEPPDTPEPMDAPEPEDIPVAVDSADPPDADPPPVDTAIPDDMEPPPTDTSCAPACGPNQCGDDGCGGSCGVCATAETCLFGQCAVAPAPAWTCLDTPPNLVANSPLQVVPNRFLHYVKDVADEPQWDNGCLKASHWLRVEDGNGAVVGAPFHLGDDLQYALSGSCQTFKEQWVHNVEFLGTSGADAAWVQTCLQGCTSTAHDQCFLVRIRLDSGAIESTVTHWEKGPGVSTFSCDPDCYEPGQAAMTWIQETGASVILGSHNPQLLQWPATGDKSTQPMLQFAPPLNGVWDWDLLKQLKLSTVCGEPMTWPNFGFSPQWDTCYTNSEPWVVGSARLHSQGMFVLVGIVPPESAQQVLLMTHPNGAVVEAVIDGHVKALDPVPAGVRVQFKNTSGACLMMSVAFDGQISAETPCPP